MLEEAMLVLSGLQGTSPTEYEFQIYLSNEKNLRWLGYIGDYTTQIYRDYNRPL